MDDGRGGREVAMNGVAFALALVLWLIAAAQLLVAGVALQRDAQRRRLVVPLLLVASATYAIGYGLELLVPTVALALAAVGVQYLAIAAFPLLMVVLAHTITRARLLASRRLRWTLAAVWLTTVALVASNALHDLFHTEARLAMSDGLRLLVFEPGPAYLAYQAVAGVVFVLVAVVLVAHAVDRRTPTHSRWQAGLTVIGAFAPWLVFLARITGLVRTDLDLTPFAFALTSALVYLAVTRYGLADVSPIARDLVFDRMLDPVFVTDAEGRVIDVNVASQALLVDLGVSRWRGRALSDVLGSDVTKAATDGEVDVRSTLVDRAPVRLARRSFDVRLARVRQRGGEELGNAVVLRDIDDYVRLQEALTQLAHTDELTGIANRRHFIELTERILERDNRMGSPTALIILDLDRFKSVNDTYGHLAGDRVLRAIARTLTSQLRPTDLLGRYGGEEFAVCLATTDEHAAYSVAERLRVAIATTSIEWDDGPAITVTASLGVHTAEANEAATLESLLALADEAQYMAKRAGGDRVVSSVS